MHNPRSPVLVKLKTAQTTAQKHCDHGEPTSFLLSFVRTVTVRVIAMSIRN